MSQPTQASNPTRASGDGHRASRTSVLIATRNRPAAVARCLTSVLNQEPPADEVIVYDDASDPSGAADEAVSQFADAVQWIRGREQRGVTFARNELMREAAGQILILLDDDAFLKDPGTVQAIVETFHAHPDAGIVTGPIEDQIESGERLLVPFRRRTRKRDPGIVDRGQPVSYFLGGFHALRRSLFEETGGYHEPLEFGEEELDLAYRTIRAGHAIWYEPTLVIGHKQHPSTLQGDDHGRRRLTLLVRNRLYLAYRYLPLRYAIPYLGVWGTVLTARSLSQRIVSPLIDGCAQAGPLLEGVDREPLDDATLDYLRAHHGRLWY